MLAVIRPRLRPHVRVTRSPADAGSAVLDDLLGLCETPHRVTAQEATWLDLLDGERTLADIHRATGAALPLEALARWVEQLDGRLLLDSPRFRQVAGAPVRPARHAGSCYSTNPEVLRRQLEEFFTQQGGPGLPRAGRPDGSLHVALLPHIDYRWGGVSYAWGFKEIVERTDASLFVIVATSHFSQHRFTLTRKHFQTPLGLVPTDGDFIDRLVRHYGDGLFDDEWLAHFPEHSVELEVVFLRWLYAGRRDLRIVPLVVGSFHDCTLAQQPPCQRRDIARMIEALRCAAEETREPICFIISGDLAHIGPKFTAGQRLTPELVQRCHAQDQALTRRLEAADMAGYFRVIARERDERSICGFPPTYLVLEALRPRAGRLLHRDQVRFVDAHGDEAVTWATVVFGDKP
jgi:AmmeMemoRadiSam system protein B